MEVVHLLKIHLVKYLPNKTKDGNLNKFNKIRRINESNTLTKHILCDYKCKFYRKKRIFKQKRNTSECQREWEIPVKKRT